MVVTHEVEDVVMTFTDVVTPVVVIHFVLTPEEVVHVGSAPQVVVHEVVHVVEVAQDVWVKVVVAHVLGAHAEDEDETDAGPTGTDEDEQGTEEDETDAGPTGTVDDGMADDEDQSEGV